MSLTCGLLGGFTILAVLGFLFANNDLASSLSPQGCRMSYMSPSYVLQDGFNASWSRLSRRYSLWLYREVGWDLQVPNGLPVLFIPGNAGSSHQVRSIASSASRQFYVSPNHISTELVSKGIQALDFYAVDFNEDLSAFHGTTLHSQIEYTKAAVDYILSQYPPNTPLIVLGHSMGGVVGTALLPFGRVSAVITMSTPHNLPPARFDSRIDGIYATIQQVLKNDSTPILSLCGGATDMMIPSESCVLPSLQPNIYRRTIFTSALEGAWTGVGHREMVWCHQVRWRVARALLELTSKRDSVAREATLDTWLRDGAYLPPGLAEVLKDTSNLELADPGSYEKVAPDLELIRRPVGSNMYLLPAPPTPENRQANTLSVLVGRGSIAGVSPQTQHSLEVFVYGCISSEEGGHPRCSPLTPFTVRLIPRSIPGQVFPSPRLESDARSGGVDGSDGVVLYEAKINSSRGQWVGLKAMNGDGEGWLVAGLNRRRETISLISTSSLLIRKALVELQAENSLRIDVQLPRLISNALIVYRLIPVYEDPARCADSLLAPLLIHTSNSVETHYYPLDPIGRRRVLLHTHRPAPYHEHGSDEGKGVHLAIYSSGKSSCINQLKGLEISIDAYATLGRWASRYMTTVVSWAAGISSIPLFLGLGIHDRGAPMPSVGQTIQLYGRNLWRFMLPASLFASLLPWPTGSYLGLGGSGMFAPLAPLILLIASGLVVAIWWVLKIFLLIFKPLGTIFATRKHEGSAVGRSTAISMGIIFAMIFFFVPWQVAYLGCWIYQVITCSAVEQTARSQNTVESHSLLDRGRDIDVSTNRPAQTPGGDQARERARIQKDNYHLNCHVLLFMTWLLPLAAPVLAVWVRTLVTAGLTTPFDGDHFFLSAAPFLVLVDFSSRSAEPIFMRSRYEDRISTRWALSSVVVVAASIGGTRPHRIFDASKISIGLLVAVRIGRRYWGGTS